MPIDRERRIIDPQRWATEWSCGKNDAAQHRHTTQTSLEATCDHLKIESTLSIEQRSCCDDTEAGDVRRRFWSLNAQIAAVGEGQAIVFCCPCAAPFALPDFARSAVAPEQSRDRVKSTGRSYIRVART